MLVTIADILSSEQLTAVRKLLENAAFVDGRLSAGKTARKVKKNHAPSQRTQHCTNN